MPTTKPKAPTKASLVPMFADVAAKAPNFRHQAFAEYLETHTGVDVDLKTVQLVMALQRPFRESPEYANAKSAVTADRERERQEAAQRRVERDKARAEALREKLAAIEATLPAPEKPKRVRPTRASAAGKQALAETAAKATGKAPARARGGKAKLSVVEPPAEQSIVLDSAEAESNLEGDTF